MTSEVVLPYAGTSGHSGSSTSEERARRDDNDGTTSARQQALLAALRAVGRRGWTWKEFALEAGIHHGQASGAFSNLHKAGRIARLSETRDRCKVYVHPDFVDGRPVEEQGQTQTTILLKDAMEFIRGLTAMSVGFMTEEEQAGRRELINRYGER